MFENLCEIKSNSFKLQVNMLKYAHLCETWPK